MVSVERLSSGADDRDRGLRDHRSLHCRDQNWFRRPLVDPTHGVEIIVSWTNTDIVRNSTCEFKESILLAERMRGKKRQAPETPSDSQTDTNTANSTRSTRKRTRTIGAEAYSVKVIYTKGELTPLNRSNCCNFDEDKRIFYVVGGCQDGDDGRCSDFYAFHLSEKRWENYTVYKSHNLVFAWFT